MLLPWRKIGRFGLVGGAVTALNYLLYLGMIGLGFHYLAATTTGWLIGVLLSFVGNKYWTFTRRGPADGREVGSFLLGYVLQLVFGSLTLFAFIDLAGIDFRVAFFLNVALTALFSYLFMDRITFAMRARRAA